jgi:NAD-dependent deacetylase
MAKVVIFSGAGISAESGLSTFRDADGLWEKYRIEEICTAGCLNWNRENTLTFYDARREQLDSVMPNAAHYAIAKLQEKYSKDIAIITQNVDDLFERAGCKDILHLHGFLPRLRCEECGATHLIGYTRHCAPKKSILRNKSC